MLSNNVSTPIYKCCLGVVMGLYCGLAMAQSADSLPDSTSHGSYALVAYLGGGISRFVGTAGTPPGFNTSINRNGLTGTFRLMWHPDHRLRLGIESGWTNFYSYEVRGGANTAKVSLTGIPLLLVFSMPVTKRLSLFAGSGAYWLTSNLDYVGKVQRNQFSIGYMASALYVVPLSARVSLAGEVKWFNARETKDTTLSLQLMTIWKFYQW